jgi:serine protease inhibitor
MRGKNRRTGIAAVTGMALAGLAVTGMAFAMLMPAGTLAQNGAQDSTPETAKIGVKGAGQDDGQALTDAYNASGLALFKQLPGSSGNIVLSPFSVGTAMAMALSGAR